MSTVGCGCVAKEDRAGIIIIIIIIFHSVCNLNGYDSRNIDKWCNVRYLLLRV
jgi:hypothetical protein